MRKSKPLLDEAGAYRYALWLLGRRPYTTGALLEKFSLRSLPAGIAQIVVEKLIAKKFLNDQAYAESMVHAKTSQNWGPSRIRTALYQKKVPREIIDQTLKSSYSPEGEARQAAELMERQKQRFLRKKEKNKGQRLRQAFEFLIRKGYSVSAARLAVNQVFSYNPDLLTEE
ncbi:MAG TPA: regulatory protein RecX [bacterium]|nr:regulatory protein RecX [bacterium]